METSNQNRESTRTTGFVGATLFPLEKEIESDRAFNSDTAPSWKSLEKILQQQNYQCALTGRNLTPQNVALDHKLAAKNGGQHVLGNCHFVHEQINRSKNTMSVEEYISLCREVVAWADKKTDTPPAC